MSTALKSLLLAVNGAPENQPAVDYGIWMAQRLEQPVELLGIVENPAGRRQVEQFLARTRESLEAAGVTYGHRIVEAPVPHAVAREALPGRHLAVFGPFGRSALRRTLRGRSFRRIVSQVGCPVLYVRASILPVRRILICMGGLGYARSAEDWGLHLAVKLGAKVSILHVIEPISYDYPTARKIQDQWEHIEETDTPQGKNLQAAIQHAQNMNISVDFKVRQGDVVHEILAEINQESCDLVVMGSSASSDKLRRLFMPNVTAEIAEAYEGPVLVASPGQDWIFSGSN